MTASQTLVVTWVQFVLAAALLLLAARAAMRWIVQPAERIRLIQFALAAAASVPLLMAFAPLPAWRLGLISAAGNSDTNSYEQTHRESSALATPFVNLPIRPDVNGPVRAPQEVASPTIPLIDRAAPASANSAAPPLPLPLDTWLLGAIAIALIHGIAAVLFLLEWLIGRARLRRLVRSAASASPAIAEMWDAIAGHPARRVRLLVSSEITTPLTFGWWRPVVVIPRDVATGDAQSLRFCLAHESSHIERADILAWHGSWLCQFLLWPQPLFWTLLRELRICQDLLADGAAADCGNDAVEYSELLVCFARKRTAAPLAGV